MDPNQTDPSNLDLFPRERRDPSQADVLHMATKLGTLDAPDRSRQYRRADPTETLRSLNELWKTSRLNEAAIRDRDKQIAELHSRLANRDQLITDQASYLKVKDLKFWVLRFALGGIVLAQWALIGWLGKELLARLR
jgi:hypothetical protein